MDSLTAGKAGLMICGMFLIFAVTFGQAPDGEAIAGCDNYLHISGESNVNQFTFTYNATERHKNKGQNKDQELIEISIPVKEFEASNPMMYNDFLDLMKESEYPRITISLSGKQLKAALAELSEPCPDINISIAGITRKYTVACSIVKCGDRLYLKGKEVVVKLSDFKLKPPSKLLGMVKVNNEINVNFGFIITFTDNNSFSATL